MATKQELIEAILENPTEFSQEQFLQLVPPPRPYDPMRLTFDDLRQLIIRIFDINERTLLQQSDASVGLMGFLNRKSTHQRQKQYFQLMNNGFRLMTGTVSGRSNKVIVAEGDSWFQFPVVLHDIIDWLNKASNHAIYSIAYGGDWFTNIIYEGKYIEELSIHRPHVFLISGSGNDLVYANRIAIMADLKGNGNKYKSKADLLEREIVPKTLTERDAEEIWQAQEFITKDLYSFIWTIKAQYWIMFDNLAQSDQLDDMMIITQGYDHAIPSLRYRWSWSEPLQYFVNALLNTGRWLKQPLMIKGIPEHVQPYLIKAFIYELNEMYKELALHFPRVYHIDARHTATSADDWYDELHLKEHRFRDVALAYDYCINANPENRKIIKVTDFRNGKIDHRLPF